MKVVALSLTVLVAIIAMQSCAVKRLAVSQPQTSVVELVTPGSNVIRISAYGPSMMRFQFAFKGDAFLPVDYRDMIEHHDWNEPLQLQQEAQSVTVSTNKVKAVINKSSLKISFYQSGNTKPIAVSKGFVNKNDSLLSYAFAHDAGEHFAGLGHDFMGRIESLDLRGKTHRRNYAQSATRLTDWKYSQQAPLIVPFYFSSKGYGIFLNSTFTNYFNLGENNQYEFGINTHGDRGEIDFVFIAGPHVKDVVTHYTDLTGKPRLPSMSVLGLQLTDKVHDHSSQTPSDEQWWKRKVVAHRSLGLAIDHLVNDNRWRAQGGQRCISVFEWDKERFPNPAVYAEWLKQNNLTITLDWNRCISAKSAGWKEAYNLQETIPFHEFPESAPDFSNPATRQWMWDLFKSNAIDTTLRFPVDGLWIDEVDEMYTIPYRHQMAGGIWGELSNYWFMLIAQALVKDGWDKYIGIKKRPYVWMRGATAGMQRYATMWSGDIDTDFEEMSMQLRGMQSAGISGFAFWGHDAGGFIDHSRRQFKESPIDSVYARWSMQLGSFSPIWKPHGMGQSRWPEDRSDFSKAVAEKYLKLRYTLMPYTYSYAHIAAAIGLPIVRPMLLEYPIHERAWQFDGQFMFGENILVAPMFKDSLDIWLPPGKWYYYWNDRQFEGDKLWFHFKTPLDEIPMWVKAGSIIPKYDYALSTGALNKQKLVVHIYPGDNARFVLTEDDGATEHYRKGEKMETELVWKDAERTIKIGKAIGNYAGAPAMREYHVIVHGVFNAKFSSQSNKTVRTAYDPNTKLLEIRTGSLAVGEEVTIAL